MCIKHDCKTIACCPLFTMPPLEVWHVVGDLPAAPHRHPQLQRLVPGDQQLPVLQVHQLSSLNKLSCCRINIQNNTCIMSSMSSCNMQSCHHAIM